MTIEKNQEFARELLREEAGGDGSKRKTDRIIVGLLLVGWAIFQLAITKFIILDSIMIRAVHLAFAITLVFLILPFSKRQRKYKFLWVTEYIPVINYILAFTAGLAALYIILDWEGISMRAGRPLPRDIVIGILLIVLLLEASRRILGIALALVAVLFTIYAFIGQYMPGIFSHHGVSLTKYINQTVLSTEGIYGIPLDVSANTVFLFVLFGAMLERVGAGQFFNDLAISLLGKFKGGPAKAAVVSSGFTGLISGSSIANVVTTGTFTIPLMKKVGYPGKTAAATEVAASTNGQLMPPIMGAAAFIIAEYLGIGYLEVVKAAAVPALVSYFALFYITHLEASKLGMRGLSTEEIPRFSKVIKEGFYFLIPLLILIYDLMVLRRTPKTAAFNAIVVLTVIVLIKEIFIGFLSKKPFLKTMFSFFKAIGNGIMAGSRNMLSVAIATATAGIVVGIVTMGIGSLIINIVERISAGNIFLLLLITAIASLILGMGLPTTATYIVMASITVPIIVKLSVNLGISPIPAVAAHLFCFYFGILADDTPPVGLAAYTASAIAESDPIATGVQGFIYDLRTAVIPFMFVFNPELILYGIHSVWQGSLIFCMAVMGAFAFTNAVQGWFLVKNKWFEIPIFLVASLIFFYPALVTRLFHLDDSLRYWGFVLGFIFYAFAYYSQKRRLYPQPQIPSNQMGLSST